MEVGAQRLEPGTRSSEARAPTDTISTIFDPTVATAMQICMGNNFVEQSMPNEHSRQYKKKRTPPFLN